MKREGFGGLLLFDARGYHEDHVPPPPSRMEFMSPAVAEDVRSSPSTKPSRLGLEVSVNLSSCAGALKGPWEVGDDAPKKLIWTSAEVRGPQRLDVRAAQPGAERQFWDVAVLAVRRAASPSADAASRRRRPCRQLVRPTGRTSSAGRSCQSRRWPKSCRSDRQASTRQGRLAWDVPAGDWTLLRFGCTTMAGPRVRRRHSRPARP